MSMIDRIRDYQQSHGTAYTLKRLGQKAAQQLLGTYDRRWMRERATEEELKAQRENQPAAGLISVVIPVYNTDPKMLGDLLDSLESQSYLNFEAVLYDGASTREETAAVLKARGEKEPRFRIVRGEENRGISGNTNEALKLARGEYIVLCDHDDLLAPDALWRTAECIVEKRPDMIYSDEDRIDVRTELPEVFGIRTNYSAAMGNDWRCGRPYRIREPSSCDRLLLLWHRTGPEGRTRTRRCHRRYHYFDVRLCLR